MRRLVFDQSSPVNSVSESRGGGTLSVTDGLTDGIGTKSLRLILDVKWGFDQWVIL